MQQMSEGVWQLVIVGGLLGVLIGFFVAFLAADAVYWRTWRKTQMGVSTPRVTPRRQAKVNKALDIAFRRAGQVSGVPAAIERVKADDGPLTVDRVLLSPGEVAVFDASGALVVWFPAPGSGVGSVVCQKSITILTYDDMPQATPRMRDQLRLLKGGRDG